MPTESVTIRKNKSIRNLTLQKADTLVPGYSKELQKITKILQLKIQKEKLDKRIKRYDNIVKMRNNKGANMPKDDIKQAKRQSSWWKTTTSYKYKKDLLEDVKNNIDRKLKELENNKGNNSSSTKITTSLNHLFLEKRLMNYSKDNWKQILQIFEKSNNYSENVKMLKMCGNHLGCYTTWHFRHKTETETLVNETLQIITQNSP